MLAPILGLVSNRPCYNLQFPHNHKLHKNISVLGGTVLIEILPEVLGKTSLHVAMNRRTKFACKMYCLERKQHLFNFYIFCVCLIHVFSEEKYSNYVSVYQFAFLGSVLSLAKKTFWWIFLVINTTSFRLKFGQLIELSILFLLKYNSKVFEVQLYKRVCLAIVLVSLQLIPLRPNSDQHTVPPYDITASFNIQVMRI